MCAFQESCHAGRVALTDLSIQQRSFALCLRCWNQLHQQIHAMNWSQCIEMLLFHMLQNLLHVNTVTIRQVVCPILPNINTPASLRKLLMVGCSGWRDKKKASATQEKGLGCTRLFKTGACKMLLNDINCKPHHSIG